MKKTFLLGAVAACGFAVSAATPFEVVALVDSLDFAHVYDIETATGTVQTLEHVLLTHPTTVLWRDKGGSLMRYPSAEEASPMGETPLDKRKLPRLSVYGNLRLERPEPDAFGIVRGECARRGLVYGIHTTWEENHWVAYTESNWNVAHPQYMCRTRRGGPRLATASLAWPEVRAHKLRLVDERLALKPQVVFLDLFRNGGWSPRMEYVKPVIERWRAKYGCEPPSDAQDPRWLALVGEDVMSYLRAFAAKCHAAGVEFHLGFKHLDQKDDYLWRMLAVDWKALAADGTLDAIVLMDVNYDPKRAYESTREILSYAKAHCGKARLYFHCSTYAMPNGIPGYVKATGQKAPDVARELLRIAKDTGCAGAYLECVDYRNYTPDICDELAWAKLRAEALARPRTFVYNTDGNDAHNWPSNLPVTVENFTGRRLVHALGTRITTVSYCPLSSGFGRLTCRKAGEAYCVNSHRGKRHVSADLFAMGTDPLDLASAFCRTNGLEIFVSIRVNDTHDAAGSFEKPDPLFPDFKKNNPDCLMGRPEKGRRPPFCNWSAVDFSHEKVRAHMRAFVRDLVENYDLDGIEYDFNRHMQLFKSVALGDEASQAELDLMTAFMRELRAITEEVGRKKNHPILVVIRAPDSVEYCRAVGIDLARWFDEKLVDIWIGGGYFCLNPWAVSAEFAHRHGVKFYASMDETRIPGVAARTNRPILKGRMTIPFYTARFADAMASGCDGVYVFNIEGDFLHKVAGIDPTRTKGMETVRFAVDRGSGGYRPWRYLKDGGCFSTLPKIDPGEPLHVKPGETCAFEVFVAGDSLAGAPNAAAKVLTNLKSGEKIAFSCNGRSFEMPEFRPGVFVCRLPVDALRAGKNAFAVTFPQSVSEKMTFNDFVLRIIPQGNQRRDAASPSRLLGVGEETVLCAGEEASFSADGRRLLFQRRVGGRHVVIVRDLATGREETISPSEGQACHPAWGSDGSVLYTHGNETKTGFAARDDSTGWNLWVWKNGARRQVTHGRQRAYAASFAPDCQTIYFSCDHVTETGKTAGPAADPNAISRAGIAAVPLDGHGAQRTVCVLPQSNSACSQPRVSPDGKLLLRAELAKFREPWRLVVSPLEHPERRTYLTSCYEAAYAPAWSPDGKLIAYTGFRDGDAGWGVYVMPSAGVVTQRIADGRNPSFTPDGKSILYDRDGMIYRREVTR